MSLVRYEPIDFKAADASPKPLYRAQRPIEVNALLLIAGGLTVVQLFKAADLEQKLVGPLPLNANVPAFFYLPPGSGIPVESGEVWLTVAPLVAVGGMFGWTLLPGGPPAIEDETDLERILGRTTR